MKVYWNSRRKNWSVLNEDTGLVFERHNYLILDNCSFDVSESGRQRVIESGKKNVHAFVRGSIDYHDSMKHQLNPLNHAGWTKVRYNPYFFDSFVRASNNYPIYNAKRVFLSDLGEVFAQLT